MIGVTLRVDDPFFPLRGNPLILLFCQWYHILPFSIYPVRKRAGRRQGGIYFSIGLLLPVKQKNEDKKSVDLLINGLCGAPYRIRTCDLLIRSQTLYPAELRAQTVPWDSGCIIATEYKRRKRVFPSAVFARVCYNMQSIGTNTGIFKRRERAGNERV